MLNYVKTSKTNAILTAQGVCKAVVHAWKVAVLTDALFEQLD